VVYVYAFVATPAVVPEVQGIDASALESERVDGLEAVVSHHEEAPAASEAAILAHARVVDALVEANDAVVPARFGALHDDASTLRTAVAGRTAELESALARIDGAVELGLRALAPSADATLARSGTDYMRARLERRRDAEELAAELHAPLAALARDTTKTVAATPRLLFSAAYLVSRDDVRAFREAVAALEEAHPELALVCTGPWPPYSFVTAEAQSA
jgi:hypothetical protein